MGYLLREETEHMGGEVLELSSNKPFDEGQMDGYKQGWHEGLDMGYFFIINSFMQEENLSTVRFSKWHF